MTDAYEVVAWRGFKFDRMTIQAIEAAEKLLGQALDIQQGSYNAGGVSASAGTHDGGGAVDVAATSMSARVVRCLRVIGFAAWERQPVAGLWGHHIHAVLIGNERLAPVAGRQVDAYRNGRDGLRSNDPDPTWRPDPIKPYVYQEDDMAAEDIWAHPLVNVQTDGTKTEQPAGKVITDLELNIDNQASRLARVEKKLDQVIALLEAQV